MRNKCFPYYKDWNIIFGKYCATGEKMETVGEAINEVLQKDKGKAPLSPVMLPTTNAANSRQPPWLLVLIQVYARDVMGRQ